MNDRGPFVTTMVVEPACAGAILEIGFESMPDAEKENNRAI